MREAPESIIWIVTSKCNLNCLHCYTSFYRREPDLGFDDVAKLIKEAADAGVEYIQFTGGEPLLRRDIFDILKFAIDSGIEVSIFTNATIVTKDIARKLSRLEVPVYTSIDGPSRDIHEALRGVGTWGKAIQGIKELVREGIYVHINVSVSEINWRYVEPTIKKAVELGASSVSIIPVMPVGNALKNNIFVSSGHMVDAIRQAERAGRELGITVSVWCAPFGRLVTSSPYVTFHNCRDWDVMDISPSGKLLLCDVLDIHLGDVTKLGIKGSWRKLMTSEILRDVLNPKLQEPCASCPISTQCRGGCYARALIRFKTHRAPDPLCPLVSR